MQIGEVLQYINNNQLDQTYTNDVFVTTPKNIHVLQNQTGVVVLSGDETIKVGQGNLEHGVTWNATETWASCIYSNAVIATIYGPY